MTRHGVGWGDRMWLGFVACLAEAGSVFDVRQGADGVQFEIVGATDTPGGEIVNWHGRPLELVILADMSVSVVIDPAGPAVEMREAMLSALRTMREEAVPGDALGVTVFGGTSRSWVPLGGLERPGLEDWLREFGPSETAPLPWASVTALRPGQWSAEPISPIDLGLDAYTTDPAAGLRTALDELRRSTTPLKAVVVLWDGEQTVEWSARQVLNRVWNHEIHVFTIAVGEVEMSGLAARGGGDVYVARGHADVAIRRIIQQLRMPAP